MNAQVTSPLVANVRQLYELWYGRASMPDWEEMCRRLQAQVNTCTAAIAVPVMSLESVEVEIDIPEGNPITNAPTWTPIKVAHERPGIVAARIAQILREAGHVVFYVSRTTAIDAKYNGQTDLLKDIMAHAPFVVFYDNPEEKRRNGFISDLLVTRQCGFMVKVEKIKGGGFNG